MRRLIDVNHVLRWSPFWPGTVRAGARSYDHINHMFCAVDYGHDGDEQYRAVNDRVALYDAAIQRQIEIAGPDALVFADYLVTRNLAGLAPGQARYGFLCWPDGAIITDTIVTHLTPGKVWLSPTNAEAILWAQGIALGSGHRVTIAEAAVASAHLHGPMAIDVLRDLVGARIDGLARFHCMPARISGADVVISRTVANPAGGFEVFASDAKAVDVWDALVLAGASHGMVVKGFDSPAEALEGGMMMISYAANSVDRITPLEFWRSFIDFGGNEFIGGEALSATLQNGGPKRRVIGLVGSAAPLPIVYDRWDIADGDQPIGFTRWATRAPVLGRNIAYGVLEVGYAERLGHEVNVRHPGGTETMTIAELPFKAPEG